MDPEQRTRLAAGESEELPPPPRTTGGRDAAELPEPPGEANLPGAGGPDDAGDVEARANDLRLPGPE